MHPFEPPYDKRLFLPIVICLLAIILTGVFAGLFVAPTEVGHQVHKVGIILGLGGVSILVIFTVLSIMPRDMNPIEKAMVLLVVIVPAIVFPIWALMQPTRPITASR